MAEFEERYDRQIRLFGTSGQQALRGQRVVVVGAGGTGSHVAQQLAHLGVGAIVTVDADRVDETSLNRMIGATPEDAVRLLPKVEVIERGIKRISADIEVQAFSHMFSETTAGEVLAGATVIFGCVDEDAERLTLLESASTREIPLVDLATDVDSDDDLLRYGGRVVFCHGFGCLSCRDLLDQMDLARAAMTPAQRAADRQIYGVDQDLLDAAGPAVVSLNGVVASLAVTEFMVWSTGLRDPREHLTYRAEQGTVARSIDEPRVGCVYCGSYLANRG